MPTSRSESFAMDYAQIENNVRAWLPTRSDIRAAAVIGSHGRTGTYAADNSADYDLLLVTTTPDSYKQMDWLHAFGRVVSAVFDPNDHVAFAYSLDFFTLYADGHDVDISVLPYDYVQRLIHDPPTREKDFVHLITPVFADGIRPLFDPEQLIPPLAAVFDDPVPFEPPSSAAFVDLVENFWQRVVRISKKLRAGRLHAAHRWSAAQTNDLMQLVEWHARLRRNLPPTTWYRDKYVEQWADPRVIAALPQIYPHYDAADIQRALFATMDLFRCLARETAQALGYPYPDSDAQVTAWAMEYLAAAESAD